MNNSRPQKYIIFLLLISILLTAFFYLFNFFKIFSIPNYFLNVFRWISLFLLIIFAINKHSLTTWILVSMVLGAEVGYLFPSVAVHLRVMSQIFLRMIKVIIAPLLFSTLVFGIAGHSNIKQLGRMAWKSLLYFEIVSTIALFIGLAAINISKAGVGVTLPAPHESESISQVKKQTGTDLILHIFPENIAKSIYEGEVLQIVIFSIFFGIAVLLIKQRYRDIMIRFTESLAETMFKFTNIIMYFAPLAVGGAIAYTVGHLGPGILVNLFKLLATLYVALFVFILFILVPIMLIYKIPILKFIQAVSQPASIAFATTSSESALPKAMENMEKFGVSRKVVAFVLPTGYSFNLDGTTLYLSLATIFVAQMAGVHLSFSQQIIIMLTLMLTSKGVAGVPRASLVILLGTLASFGLPVESVFIILGIDELMDMGRTSVNVIGNCLASAVIAKSENEFDVNKAANFSIEKTE